MNLKKKSGLDRIDVPFEVKNIFDDDADSDFFIFEGFASTFGNLDLVDDIVMPGAFSKSIEKSLPVILWQHNSNEPIGMTAEIKETHQGLFIRAKLPKDDSFVKNRVMPQLRIGSIKSMSIGFIVINQEIDLDDGRIRRLTEVDLKEVSSVTFPANEQAVITDVKKITVDDVKEIKTRREFEKFLREAGLSKSAAEMVVSNKFNESLQGDPVDDLELKNALKAMTEKFDEKMVLSELSKISKKVNTHVRRN